MERGVAANIPIRALYANGTPYTGGNASIQIRISSNGGGTWAQLANTTVLEANATFAQGWYFGAANATEMNVTQLLVTGNSSTANVVLLGYPIALTPANFSLAGINGNGESRANLTLNSAGNLPSNLLQIAGNATRASNLGLAANVANLSVFLADTFHGGAAANIQSSLSGDVVGDVVGIVAGDPVAVSHAFAGIGVWAAGDGNAALLTAAGYTAPDNAGISTAAIAAASAAVSAALAAGRIGGNQTITGGAVVSALSSANVTGALAASLTAANVTGNLPSNLTQWLGVTPNALVSGNVPTATSLTGNVTVGGYANAAVTPLQPLVAGRQIAVDASGNVSMGSVTVGAISATVGNEIADYVQKRSQENVANSSVGDAISKHSLYGFIQSVQNGNTAEVANTLTIRNPNGTLLGNLSLSANATAPPIVGVSG